MRRTTGRVLLVKFSLLSVKVKGVGDVERTEEERVESHTWAKTVFFFFVR